LVTVASPPSVGVGYGSAIAVCHAIQAIADADRWPMGPRAARPPL